MLKDLATHQAEMDRITAENAQLKADYEAAPLVNTKQI